MITNIGANATFYCRNGHEKPIKMKLMEGDTKFYACPHYFLKDDKHPDGYDPMDHETSCNNRLSLDDAAGIIEKYGELIDKDTDPDLVANWTNLRFRYKQIDVIVLKDSTKELRFGIFNRGAIL